MTACQMSPDEIEVLASAEHFVACAFRGRGRFDKLECPTREAAIEAARRMIKKDRPTLVYAVKGIRSACTAIVYPN